MSVRWTVLLSALASAAISAQNPAPVAPASQQPVFRTGVELLTVDATVVDRDGRQITDLTPNEFTVEVDGNVRPVVSAEYVKLVDDSLAALTGAKPVKPAPPPDEAYFSTNARVVTPGRHILILIDQGNIRTGQGRGMMRSAIKFVDGLRPTDRLAMVAIPNGALVDFTTDHEKIREALLVTVGQATPFKGRFHISLSEAIATVEHSDFSMRVQLINRECGHLAANPVEAARCEIEVEQQAAEMVSHQRVQTQNSLRGMREVLKSLAALDGPKSVILISEGLVLEGLSNDMDDLAALAADVRASLDVMMLDVPAIDVTESQRPSTPREDRDRQTAGLEELAGRARGAMHRIVASGDNAFTRIMRSISGHYLLAVEARPTDRDGRRHKIQVKSNRRGVTVYSRRGFLAPTAPAATSAADAVGRALRAPLTMNDLRMRIATWTYKEPGGARVRVLVAAEVERGTDQSMEYTAGLLVIDRNNKIIVNSVEPRKLLPVPHDPSIAAYAGGVLLEPGTYLFRFAVADSEGRMGSVERKLEAWHMDGAALTVGDLLIGQVPTDKTSAIRPAVEPHVTNGQLATLMEVYASTPQALKGFTANLEILAREDAKPLMTSPMQISAGPSAEVGALHASVNTAALPPGRYFARAVVTEGGKPRGHITRPFRVVAGAVETGDRTSAYAPSVLPGELAAAMLANLPAIERKDLLAASVLSSVFDAAERSRPGAKAAFATAKAGKLGPAALEALGAGDQPAAAFIRGVEFFSQGNMERATQQFQIAMQQAPSLTPARLYLGVSLAQSNRHREAASLLQSVPLDTASSAPIAQMAALSWLRAGEFALAIAALEKLGTPDAASARTLALAYVIGNRSSDAVPLLTKYLDANPKDQEALLAGVYAIYASHTPNPRPATIAADRTRAQGWAKAYAAQKGAHQLLVDAWITHLQGIQ
jgi:VWFA-related protein